MPYIVLYVGCFIFGMGVGGMIEESLSERHTEIIQNNCAEYDSKTGEFKWKDEE